MADLIVLQFLANVAGCIRRNRTNDHGDGYTLYRNGECVGTIGAHK